ncbi:MAG: PHP domain-containing protein [Verrucomicrobiales bacterium]|nr:PHP domain-containing protein [Verrucomicrobiales bacterium]
MFADLHLHTSFSDGTYTPEELVVHAHPHDLGTLALTDHDTIEGCARMALACQRSGLEFIPGTELTTELHGQELHLLAYFIDTRNPRLLRELAHFQTVRQNRIREIVAQLNRIDIPLQAEAVLALAQCSSPGRPHVGRALVQGGFCATVDEAFERFLKRNRPAWVPKSKMFAGAAIELIHQAGGLAAIAHPGLNHNDSLIGELKGVGLDALECFHSRHTPSQTAHYLALAPQLGLLITGGSDCHGMNKGEPLIGSVKLDYEHVERLKERIGQLRARGDKPACPTHPTNTA